jgi:Antitoxin VbhA
MNDASYLIVPAPSCEQMCAERARQVRAEVNSARLEGLEPVPEFFLLAERYVSGALTLEQFSAAVQNAAPLI